MVELAWSGVARAHIAAIWPHVEPLLGPVITASPDGFNSIPEAVERLKDGRFQLWVVHPPHALPITLALVTDLVSNAGGVTCRCQYLGGADLKSAWDLFQVVIAWAKEQGADLITAYPRKGLARRLKKYDFQRVGSEPHGDLYARTL